MTRTGQPIRPVVIAHRGASGYLPEHTFAAKALAYAMGADYLEQDVVATQDDELVVMHDIHLDRTTNVAAQYPGRARADGRYYVRDFALAEVKMLAVNERTDAAGQPVYPGRIAAATETHRINTFGEELDFIAELVESGDRPVGVYAEIKRPAWHLAEGFDITPAFLDALRHSGYESYTDSVYVQCFDESELIRIREELHSDLKLIQLIGENDWQESETDYQQLQSAAALRRLAKTVDGIGPWIRQLYIKDDTGAVVDTGLVGKAHDAGLCVHPYTFRRDELPSGFSSFEELLTFAIDKLSIDGLFTDFPDLVVNR